MKAKSTRDPAEMEQHPVADTVSKAPILDGRSGIDVPMVGRADALWWRFSMVTGDGRKVEVDFASGASIDDARRHILAHIEPGARRIRPLVRYHTAGQVEVQHGN